MRFAMEDREAREATNTHKTFRFGFKGGTDAMPGAGGISIRSADNEHGARDLEIVVRPVLLGLVEWYVTLAAQAIGRKGQSKRAFLYTTPAAAREFAAQLLAAADEADRTRPRPRPVK